MQRNKQPKQNKTNMSNIQNVRQHIKSHRRFCFSPSPSQPVNE